MDNDNINSNQISYSMGYRKGKEETLEKVYKWLNQHMSEYAFSIYDEDDNCSVSMDLIDDLKEAMK